jgi:hypothetical protein
MFEKVLNLLRWSCRHRRLTTPFSTDTARQSQTFAAHPEEIPSHCSHYVVCLDCGRRFGYDWGEMRIIKQRLDKVG